MLRNRRMKSPLRTSVVLTVLGLLGLCCVYPFALRHESRARFELARRTLVNRGDRMTAVDVAGCALLVPKNRYTREVLAEALLSRDLRERLLAATVVEYWDVRLRGDGLLPRPEHHAAPLDELLPLLPAIERAQSDPGDLGELVDACLVTVWDEATVRGCVEHETHRAPTDERGRRMHRELVGILTDFDPRPREKDGFGGLVYGYGSDEALLARIK